MVMESKYTDDEVRQMIEEFRKENLMPHYKILAQEIGIAYTHFIAFKNGSLNLSEEYLNKIVTFIESKSR